MQEKKQSLFPSLKLVAIAALAGVVAGAVAVYMKEQGQGNGSGPVASIDCSRAETVASALQPLAKGEVAAFIPVRKSEALILPAFKDATGKDVKLQDFAPRVQLVNLWATWCVPCRAEMPALNTLQKQLGGPDFQVTAINLDTGDSAKPGEFLAEEKIDALALYHDGTLSSFNSLKKAGIAFGLPASVLIDAKGCMLGSMNGPAVWDSEDAKTLIKAAQGSGA